MYSEVDNGRGLVRCHWRDVRDEVKKVEPRFAELVDELDPGNEFAIYKAYFPYGDITCDTETPFMPLAEGGYIPLNQVDPNNQLYKDLGYGVDSLPLGMVLTKQLHYYIDFPEQQISIPWRIYTPGAIFPMARILSNHNRIYAPNGVTTTSAGARSIFMLPNIGCATQHSNLQRDFNVTAPTPKSLYEHFEIFKQIYDSQIVPCNWRSCVLYFSEEWVNRIATDPQWQTLKLHFYEQAWLGTEYPRNKIYFDIIYSVIQRQRNLKPNPYLVDTAQHLFTTTLGDTPGYIPASDEAALPTEMIQKVYLESYNLKKYIPTIMQPHDYVFESETLPIYYSLQNPTTYIFSPKSRKVSSTLYDLRELKHIIDIFTQQLKRDDDLAYDTVLNEFAKESVFNYYHNKADPHNVITDSTEIQKHDPRFDWPEDSSRIFASDAPFVRGCISMRTEKLGSS